MKVAPVRVVLFWFSLWFALLLWVWMKTFFCLTETENRERETLRTNTFFLSFLIVNCSAFPFFLSFFLRYALLCSPFLFLLLLSNAMLFQQLEKKVSRKERRTEAASDSLFHSLTHSHQEPKLSKEREKMKERKRRRSANLKLKKESLPWLETYIFTGEVGYKVNPHFARGNRCYDTKSNNREVSSMTKRFNLNWLNMTSEVKQRLYTVTSVTYYVIKEPKITSYTGKPGGQKKFHFNLCESGLHRIFVVLKRGYYVFDKNYKNNNSHQFWPCVGAVGNKNTW